MPLRNTPTLQDYGLLISLSAMFGASFMFTRLALNDFSPLTVVTARLGIASLILLPLMLLAGQHLPAGKIWKPIALCSFFGNALPFSLISWAQQEVDAGVTAIFMAFMPLATVVLAHRYTSDEKLNRLKAIGVVLGMAGVAVLMGGTVLNQLGDQGIRQLAIVAATVCYAINAILTRQLTSVPRRSLITALLLSATLMMIPVWLISKLPMLIEVLGTDVGTGASLRMPDLKAVLSVLLLAAGPTALATLMIIAIIDRQGASFLSQINFLVPLFGAFFGTVFLSERLPANAWLALMIILLGIALVRRGARSVT